jgi:SAM-dependent methyltransferase
MGNEVSPQELLRQLVGGFISTQLVYVVAKLGIADQLRQGPRSSAELAQATGVDAGALRRVLRGLVNRGLFLEVEVDRFALTAAGELLKSDMSVDMRGAAINAGELLYGAWGELLRTVRTAEPGFELRYGMKWFEYLAQHPENARIFNKAMASATAMVAAAVREAYDFSHIHRLADLGGGQGVLLAELLKAWPHMRGVLFDAQSVIAGAGPILAAAGVAERCELVAGDFFAQVPPGCDAYIMKSIIHDWDDEDAKRILKSCRAAMGPGGRLLLVEPIMPGRVQDFSFAVETDLGMMVLLDGLERTAEQYRALLAACGFELTRLVPTSRPFSVIEARPVEA